VAGTIYHQIQAVESATTDDGWETRMDRLGLSPEELQAEIELRMYQLDEAQEDAEHLGAYGDLFRMVALAAFQRAADLISVNNDRLTAQLQAAGLRPHTEGMLDRATSE
jgi:hypothetical protein